MEAIDIVPMLFQRINSLESILVSTLISFLVTTTLAIFSIYYQSKDNSKLTDNPVIVIIFINVLYIFLSGYYYFMLTHFYATYSILEPYLKGISGYRNLWVFFSLPQVPFFFSDYWRIVISLLSAPLFPLFFSFATISGVCLLLRKDSTTKLMTTYTILFSFLAQLTTCYLMIFYPFVRFLECIKL